MATAFWAESPDGRGVVDSLAHPGTVDFEVAAVGGRVEVGAWFGSNALREESSSSPDASVAVVRLSSTASRRERDDTQATAELGACRARRHEPGSRLRARLVAVEPGASPAAAGS
jgi:hypothetical protein